MSERDARRAKVKLLYDGVDISADISPYLLSFSYVDNAHGKADDIQVTLQDRERRWREPWYPKKGSVLDITVSESRRSDHDGATSPVKVSHDSGGMEPVFRRGSHPVSRVTSPENHATL